MRVAGGNAGHTVYGECPPSCTFDPGAISRHAPSDHVFNERWIGHPWRLRQVPVSAVSNRESVLLIAAGSEIDKDVLDGEITALDSAGYKVSDRLFIDSQATMVRPHHVQLEKSSNLTERLGSTSKGIGAARSERIWRIAEIWKDTGAEGYNTSEAARATLNRDETVIIEGTQGYALGLHAGNYPYCTSSDCRAIDFLAMAGISPWDVAVTQFEVWVVARTRPIRVAGNSGPLKNETSWEALGLPEEKTTVTKKTRRVGEWDSQMVRDAVIANGGYLTTKIALTMLDHVFPDIAFEDDYRKILAHPGVADYLRARSVECGVDISMVGTSPITMVELPDVS